MLLRYVIAPWSFVSSEDPASWFRFCIVQAKEQGRDSWGAVPETADRKPWLMKTSRPLTETNKHSYFLERAYLLDGKIQVIKLNVHRTDDEKRLLWKTDVVGPYFIIFWNTWQYYLSQVIPREVRNMRWMQKTTDFICFSIEQFKLRSFRFNATKIAPRLLCLFFHSFYILCCFVFTAGRNDERSGTSRVLTTCPTDAALIWLSKPSSVPQAVASFFHETLSSEGPHQLRSQFF